MNYQKIHDSIIENAKNRKLPKEVYTERHHVLPKSMGGDDEKSNLVVLTGREHFIIHWLLYKIHKNPQMTYAFFAMTKPGNKSQHRYTSWSFHYARQAISNFMSLYRSGENHPFYGLRGENNPHYGMKRSDATKALLSECASIRTSDKNGKSRKVINIETNEIFDTLTAARKKHGGNISYAIKDGGTAGGYHFAYLDDYNSGNYKFTSNLKGYRSGSNSPTSKAVIDSAGNVYETVRLAAEAIGVTGSAISWAIKNKKTVKGKQFKFLGDENDF